MIASGKRRLADNPKVAYSNDGQDSRRADFVKIRSSKLLAAKELVESQVWNSSFWQSQDL
jgi:hypothetical protein